MMRLICFVFAVCTTSTSVFAQGAMLQLYGEGVHRYFAGDLMGAEQLFTRVIASGSDDPRPYYFRGLIHECRGFDGTADFEYGARLEATGRNSVAVGQALTRIQGHVRSEIEKARRDARVEALQQRMAMEAARSNAEPPADIAPEATTPEDTANPVPAPDSPFEDGMRSDATTEDEVQPATPEVDAATDPFTDDAAPAPADTEPAAEPPAGNPFGGEMGTDDGGSANPFGGSGADDAGTANPFGGDASGSGGGANPFGGDSSGGSSDSSDAANPFGN